jgi:hypothetical protein
MKVEKTKVVATKVTKKTAELIAGFCKRDTHVNPARALIRLLLPSEYLPIVGK